MKLLIHLAGDNVKLAKDEAIAALGMKKPILDGRYLIGEAKPSDALLGYSHAIYEFLFSCPPDKIFSRGKDFDWQQHCQGSFRVRASASERQLAFMVYQKLKNPKVNLKRAKTEFRFFVAKKAYACRLLSTMPSALPPTTRWPGFHPASSDPRLVRALVNLTGLRKGTLLDPLCGIGTIPIEASLHGLRAEGSDLDEDSIKMAKKNARHFHAKVKFSVKDGLRPKKADAIVTDLPYGKNSAFHIRSGGDFYENFFKNAVVATKRLVAVIPIFPGRKTHIGAVRKSWRIIGRYEIRIHRSLSRLVLNCSPKP